jgi:sortase (surface protein transpeptidase)
MELNKIKIGDKFVFTGSLENFNTNEVYTINRIYKIDDTDIESFLYKFRQI